MTKKNAELIGSLFHKLVRFESFTRTNIIGSKYLRMQVEVDMQKPILAGFFHNLGQGGQWIPFKYEKLLDFCYRCGKLGHVKGIYSTKDAATHKILGNLYNPWIRAEMDATILFKEGDKLRRMENPHFDNFEKETNMDQMNLASDERVLTDGEDDGEEIGPARRCTPLKNCNPDSTILCQSTEESSSRKETLMPGVVRAATDLVVDDGRKENPALEGNRTSEIQSIQQRGKGRDLKSEETPMTGIHVREELESRLNRMMVGHK